MSNIWQDVKSRFTGVYSSASAPPYKGWSGMSSAGPSGVWSAVAPPPIRPPTNPALGQSVGGLNSAMNSSAGSWGGSGGGMNLNVSGGSLAPGASRFNTPSAGAWTGASGFNAPMGGGGPAIASTALHPSIAIPPNSGRVATGAAGRGFKNALRNGKGVMGRAPLGSGLLATAIGAGTVGAFAGNGDAQSFAIGLGGGLAGGFAAKAGAGAIYKGLTSLNRKPAGALGAHAMEAIGIGRMMTANSNRGMIFAAGALLSGGLFSSMFSSSNKSLKQGFNSNRGNGITR